jgi:hypothetical protein
MGVFKRGGGSSGSGNSGTSTNRDPYISGNRDDWNNRPKSDGENFKTDKKDKDKK